MQQWFCYYLRIIAVRVIHEHSFFKQIYANISLDDIKYCICPAAKMWNLEFYWWIQMVEDLSYIVRNLRITNDKEFNMEEKKTRVMFLLLMRIFNIESRTFIASSFHSQYLHVYNSTDVLERHLIETFTVAAMAGCATQCVSTKSCFSFFYNDNINICSLHSNIFLQTYQNAKPEGWSYFKTG